MVWGMRMASRATQYRTAQPALIEQRAAMRLPVAISNASVRKLADQPADAVLRDLSIYGCRIETREPFAAEERVWVRLGGSLPVAATVVWSDGGALGCRFDVPIARALLRSIVLTLA